ncbi:MBOAT-domain-containing protein [Macrolepiota fuliginosa MF-IS2]|uniref:O-acyltransferase n=1 Tax=Macrolepiota fuliginosa MF-IS2 TaxID=1400762 RepID=A0A9P5XP29_9AGAR|nr:MBOAT-domain-containing protein [Macrolepiota fuliginosa MF-IS2]
MATIVSSSPPKDKSLLEGKRDGFNTTEGTLYVSKPYRSKNSRKLRALITFTPRKSAFDTNNEASGVNEFRGFFSLFWVSIFLWTVRTYITSIEASGVPLKLDFATMFSQDAITLAISDFVLVLSTGLCVPIAMAINKGWIRYYWTGLVLQHLLQTMILFTAITWTFNRKWPWVQSGFLTLHSLVMVMKMHSYLSVNGHLHSVSQQSRLLLRQIERATLEFGGLDQALKDAGTPGTSNENSMETTRSGTPDIPEGSSSSYIDPSAANLLRKRLTAMAAKQDNNVHFTERNHSRESTNSSTISSSSTIADVTEEAVPLQHPLVSHPDQELSTLAKEYSDLQGELVSPGPGNVSWPNNVTWKNFAEYQLIPTLVYELEYPRTNKIRPLYIFEKTVATFGTFALLYTVTESFILPLTPTSEQSFFRSLLDLALPFMMAYLLLFYIIFECICNGFAELSRFADRQFYEDWWNSVSWDEFSRKWNKPVHGFLLRHVYAPLIYNCGFSRTTAMLFTFFLSACAHELVMVVVTKKIRLYLFTLQLVQIPMILLSRHPIIKRNKLMGNVVFWLGLYAGFPLLCVAYVAY